MRRPVLLLLVGVVAPHESGNAQSAIPRLRAVEEMRIDGTQHEFTDIRHLLTLPDGWLAVTSLGDPRVAYFDGTGRPAGAFGRKGSGPGEFQQIVHAGLLGDTLWIADLSLSRVTFVGSDRNLVSTRPLPRRVRVPRDRVSGSAPEPMFLLQGIVGDRALGAAIPMPDAPWPVYLPHLGPGSPIVTIAPDGQFREVLGWNHRNPQCSVQWDAGTMRGTMPVPFCAGGIFAVSQNGQWLAFVEQENSGSPSAHFTLTVVHSAGDTISSRRIPYAPVAVRKHAADSAVDRVRGFRGGLTSGGLPPQALAAIDRIEVPTTHAPVAALVLGPDGAVWVGLERGEARLTWRGLLPDGTPLGELAMPRNVKVINATATMLWTVETDQDGVPSVVRYRVMR